MNGLRQPIRGSTPRKQAVPEQSRLQAFGIWAEIVAVVVSLVFVGLEVRQSAEETDRSTEVV